MEVPLDSALLITHSRPSPWNAGEVDLRRFPLQHVLPVPRSPAAAVGMRHPCQQSLTPCLETKAEAGKERAHGLYLGAAVERSVSAHTSAPVLVLHIVAWCETLGRRSVGTWHRLVSGSVRVVVQLAIPRQLPRKRFLRLRFRLVARPWTVAAEAFTDHGEKDLLISTSKPYPAGSAAHPMLSLSPQNEQLIDAARKNPPRCRLDEKDALCAKRKKLVSDNAFAKFLPTSSGLLAPQPAPPFPLFPPSRGKKRGGKKGKKQDAYPFALLRPLA
eukprot:scaffold1951_cov258-Pinguiococcus_pyrenoidosus.AAC.25